MKAFCTQLAESDFVAKTNWSNPCGMLAAW
jgi:hypothetical protein